MDSRSNCDQVGPTILLDTASRGFLDSHFKPKYVKLHLIEEDPVPGC